MISKELIWKGTSELTDKLWHCRIPLLLFQHFKYRAIVPRHNYSSKRSISQTAAVAPSSHPTLTLNMLLPWASHHPQLWHTMHDRHFLWLSSNLHLPAPLQTVTVTMTELSQSSICTHKTGVTAGYCIFDIFKQFPCPCCVMLLWAICSPAHISYIYHGTIHVNLTHMKSNCIAHGLYFWETSFSFLVFHILLCYLSRVKLLSKPRTFSVLRWNDLNVVSMNFALQAPCKLTDI